MQWLDQGLKNIWLPYTQMKKRPEPLLPVVSAKGCKIILSDGRELIDGISSWWSVCHGYSHPYIVEKIIAQVKKLSHVMFAGCGHEQAYVLTNRLTRLFSGDLSRVFFSDSGSNAVEVALKMAVQYFYNLGNKNKSKFISFNNSYHGDTAGCMSVSSSCIQGNVFTRYVKKQYMVPISDDLNEFKKLITLKNDEIAGVIIEPILQAAGGMKIHSADILREIYQITKEHDVLFIADEIATGFYRLGKMFACDYAGIIPDIITLGKGLTGGMCSLGATVASEKIFSAFLSDELTKAFMHGPTFMANPIACAAANASLDLFERDNYFSKIQAIEDRLKENLSDCIDYEKVRDVRIKGAVAALEMRTDWQTIFALRKEAVNLGVWIRPFADVIYLMPPFIIDVDELNQLTSVVKLLASR
ncbi:MAG: adenosylmethionine--8-amino-7-oxononanoate transaminase [Rickettsiaceae bacterium H1]|nr:adenosylmethionine--8-amino-7-oxononanoate transaminase [Rickettsiaceae bacterium H1]